MKLADRPDKRHMKRTHDSNMSSLLAKLAGALDEAVGLLNHRSSVRELFQADATMDEASLLEQCIALSAQQLARPPEPVRTIHHFACAGGTLISKCIAALPNVQLFSEMDPLSSLYEDATRPTFSPTDFIIQLRQNTRGVDQALLIKAFQSQLILMHEEAVRRGLRLVIRDHSHSHYCSGPQVPSRPSLRAMVSDRLPCKALVTVRDPIDSYASLVLNKWITFQPADFDEYCRRYMRFLDDYVDVPVMRYEDFVADADGAMGKVCEVLDLPINPAFKEVFDVFRITGDSGRSGGAIHSRPRRSEAEEFARQAQSSLSYAPLANRLGY